MSNAESREDGQSPPENVADLHRDRQKLKQEDNDAAETTRYEVNEQSEDLCIDVRRESERPYVGVGHNRERIEHEK